MQYDEKICIILVRMDKMKSYLQKPRKPKSKQASFNFDRLSADTYNELALQQSKRDKIITVFVALMAIIVPLSFGENSIISPFTRGVFFGILAFIGIIFAKIIMRYRIYKECYWFAYQTLLQLNNYEEKEIKKQLVQSLFVYSMYKKYKKYFDETGKKLKVFKFVKDNLFSAETLYYLIHVFVTAVLTAFSVFFLLSRFTGVRPALALPLLLPACLVALVVAILLFIRYFYDLYKTFKVLKYADKSAMQPRPFGKKAPVAEPTTEDKPKKSDKPDKVDLAFNFAFSKAWMLHFYLDD